MYISEPWGGPSQNLVLLLTAFKLRTGERNCPSLLQHAITAVPSSLTRRKKVHILVSSLATNFPGVFIRLIPDSLTMNMFSVLFSSLPYFSTTSSTSDNHGRHLYSFPVLWTTTIPPPIRWKVPDFVQGRNQSKHNPSFWNVEEIPDWHPVSAQIDTLTF